MKGFVILPRFRNEGPSRSLAYYHPKDSLTWRWGLSVQWRFPDWKCPKNWLRVSRFVYPTGDAGTLHVGIGPWGFQFQWQPTRAKHRERSDGV